MVIVVVAVLIDDSRPIEIYVCARKEELKDGYKWTILRAIRFFNELGVNHQKTVVRFKIIKYLRESNVDPNESDGITPGTFELLPNELPVRLK